ncbi:MAG: hypothetical protein IJB70_02420, partial [Clostridia bacterium]|nr:hypothetical protein [Clostridia bacterium]
MSETYYALEKFAEMDRNLVSITEALPIKRRAIDIYRQKNNEQRAKDTYTDLVQLKSKLLDTVRNLRLLFSECQMPEGADFANKLFGAVNGFNLMTPDYTKLLQAIEALKKQIPHSEKINAQIIGHLMNNVKMGYYPTDNSHVKMIKSALKFPECEVNLLDPCC